MSTKTNFKRIALVAVAALGLGVLSSVPSQAAVTGLTVTAVNGTAALGQANDTVTAAVVSVEGLATVGTADTITVTFVQKGALPAAATARMAFLDTATTTPGTNTALSVTTGIASTSAATASTTTLAIADTITAGASGFSIRHIGSSGYMSARFKVQLDSATASRDTAGTYNYTAIATPYVAGVAGTSVTKDFSITIAALASASTVASPTLSTVHINDTASTATDEVLAVDATASNTASAYLYVVLRNASNTTSAAESVTVTTNIGQVGDGASQRGRSVVLKYTAGGTNFEIYPDGTAGVATITISTPSVTFASKSITFFSTSAKSLVATVATPRVALGSNSDVVRVAALDSAGNVWAGTAYIYASTAADALIAGSNATPVACTWDPVDNRHECPVTGISAGTAKLKVIDASTVALATATSNEVSVVVNANTAASVKLSFDKATYSPNERAFITITPLDKDGKEIAAGTWSNLFASGGISVNGALTYPAGQPAESLTAVSITTAGNSSSTTGAIAGSKVYTVFMPAAGGKVTVSATGGSSLPLAGQVAVTASATVTDSGAAALAAVTALATTVASLKTLITTLTNLVLKIQKKVKA